jgi:hypothetical protein
MVMGSTISIIGFHDWECTTRWSVDVSKEREESTVKFFLQIRNLKKSRGNGVGVLRLSQHDKILKIIEK